MNIEEFLNKKNVLATDEKIKAIIEAVVKSGGLLSDGYRYNQNASSQVNVEDFKKFVYGKVIKDSLAGREVTSEASKEVLSKLSGVTNRLTFNSWDLLESKKDEPLEYIFNLNVPADKIFEVVSIIYEEAKGKEVPFSISTPLVKGAQKGYVDSVTLACSVENLSATLEVLNAVEDKVKGLCDSVSPLYAEVTDWFGYDTVDTLRNKKASELIMSCVVYGLKNMVPASNELSDSDIKAFLLDQIENVDGFMDQLVDSVKSSLNIRSINLADMYGVNGVSKKIEEQYGSRNLPDPFTAVEEEMKELSAEAEKKSEELKEYFDELKAEHDEKFKKDNEKLAAYLEERQASETQEQVAEEEFEIELQRPVIENEELALEEETTVPENIEPSIEPVVEEVVLPFEISSDIVEPSIEPVVEEATEPVAEEETIEEVEKTIVEEVVLPFEISEPIVEEQTVEEVEELATEEVVEEVIEPVVEEQTVEEVVEPVVSTSEEELNDKNISELTPEEEQSVIDSMLGAMDNAIEEEAPVVEEPKEEEIDMDSVLDNKEVSIVEDLTEEEIESVTQEEIVPEKTEEDNLVFLKYVDLVSDLGSLNKTLNNSDKTVLTYFEEQGLVDKVKPEDVFMLVEGNEVSAKSFVDVQIINHLTDAYTEGETIESIIKLYGEPIVQKKRGLFEIFKRK